jgi:hypothetical protein
MGGVLRLQGIGHVVALGWDFKVEKQCAHVSAAFRVRNPQSGAAFQDVRPGAAAANTLFPQNNTQLRTGFACHVLSSVVNRSKFKIKGS